MYAATLLERHKIFEFIPALLPNHSSLPQNRLAVYEERPGQFVKGSGTGALVVSEQTR